MAVVDTTSPAYQTRLTGLTNLFDEFKVLYAPTVKLMTSAQLKDLRQRDPLFAKFVQIGQELALLGEKVGLD